MFFDAIEADLAERDRRSLCRRLPTPIAAPGPAVRVGDRRLVCLNSNNYLGLASHPDVVRAAIAAVEAAGASATGSRLLSGSLALHEELERRLAAFKGTPAALLMNSGYAANLGVLAAIAGPGDLIVGDRLNHASLIDGARLSGAEVRHAPHCDLSRMAALLGRSGFRRRLLAIDGVFSMDGDIAPLAGLLDLCRRFDALLVLDDAHATGVLGPCGRGSLEHAGFWGAPDLPPIVQIGTLSKALGGFGAFVTASRSIVDLLVNDARPFVFSTALPPAVLGAALGALDVLEREPWRIADLKERADQLRDGLIAQGIPVPEGSTPIVPVVVGDNARTVELAARLQAAGVLAQAVRPPSVPEGSARLRLTAMATHSRDDIGFALEQLGRLVQL